MGDRVLVQEKSSIRRPPPLGELGERGEDKRRDRDPLRERVDLEGLIDQEATTPSLGHKRVFWLGLVRRSPLLCRFAFGDRM